MRLENSKFLPLYVMNYVMFSPSNLESEEAASRAPASLEMEIMEIKCKL